MGSNSVTKPTLGKNSFQIDSSGGTGDTYGILGGSVDGSNTTFTVSLGSYVSGSLEVQLNGQLLTQGSAEDWEETTPASGTFTLSIAPEIGDILIVKYQYQTVTTGNADTLDGHHSTDFVTNTVAGEFENKIIDGDKNTLLDIVYSSIKSTDRSGSDTTLITGTKGTDGDLAQWNSDGDLVDSKTPPTGDIVGTTDTQTLTNKTLTSPLFQGTVGGWILANETWTYASADDPTFTFTVAADVTTKYSAGMKIKLTQTTVKYFIITAVSAFSGGNTTITVYGGTDYDLASATITSPYYSMVRSPFGFPLNKSKWSVTVKLGGKQYVYTFATFGNWEEPLNGATPLPEINIPIGVWDFDSDFMFGFEGKSTADDNFRYRVGLLDSANTSASATDIAGYRHVTTDPSANSPYNRFEGSFRLSTAGPEVYTSKRAKKLKVHNDGDYGIVKVGSVGSYPDGGYFRWTCAYL